MYGGKKDEINKKLDHNKNAKDDQLMEIIKILENAQNAQELPSRIFPNEQWISIFSWQPPALLETISDKQTEILDQELA